MVRRDLNGITWVGAWAVAAVGGMPGEKSMRRIVVRRRFDENEGKSLVAKTSIYCLYSATQPTPF